MGSGRWNNGNQPIKKAERLPPSKDETTHEISGIRNACQLMRNAIPEYEEREKGIEKVFKETMTGVGWS